MFHDLTLVMTECLTWFLISLVCFLFIKNFEQEKISWYYIIFTSFSIAYLAMTKIIFGYVILTLLFISIFLYLFPRFRSSAKKSAIIFLFAFLFCLPYLFYTYSLTNKIFYWGSSGYDTLYTMSTPFENEYGDWMIIKNSNHSAFIDSVNKLEPLQRDEVLKMQAIKNIKSHPLKYIWNWTANVGRLLFSYPYSYADQTMKTYFTIVPNMFIVVFIVFSLAVSIFYFQKLPVELFLLLLFISVIFIWK